MGQLKQKMPWKNAKRCLKKRNDNSYLKNNIKENAKSQRDLYKLTPVGNE